MCVFLDHVFKLVSNIRETDGLEQIIAPLLLNISFVQK